MGHRMVKMATALTVCALALASGCMGKKYDDINTQVQARARGSRHLDEINGLYKIGPPDKLKITVRDNPDLNTETTVRPDGYITFPFSKLHDVYAEGLTPKQLAEDLTQKLSQYIKEVDVTVEVKDFQSRRVFVFGEVYMEGPQPFTGDVSLVDALASAKSIKNSAADKRILIVRGDPVNPEVFKVNVRDVIRRADSVQNVMLKENDIVYVPPNVFAAVGYQIDNALWPFRSIMNLYYLVSISSSSR